MNPLARLVILSHKQHQLRVGNRLENAAPGLQAARVHLGGIVEASPGEAPATRARAWKHRQDQLRRLVNPGDLGQTNQAFGKAILYPRRIGLVIRQSIVDRREPRRIGLAKPGHLHRRRTAVHHTQSMPGGVARKVNEHVGLVGYDLIGRRLVAQSIDPSPKIRPVAKLAGPIISRAPGFVGVDLYLLRGPLPPNRRQQAAHRMLSKITREKTHAERHLIQTTTSLTLHTALGRIRGSMPLGPTLVLFPQSVGGSGRIIMQREQQIAVRRHCLGIEAQGCFKVLNRF